MPAAVGNVARRLIDGAAAAVRVGDAPQRHKRWPPLGSLVATVAAVVRAAWLLSSCRGVAIARAKATWKRQGEMEDHPRDGKQNQRRRRGRRHHKKRPVAKHDGCLVDRLVVCCAASAPPRGSPKQGIGFDDLPGELVAAILAPLPCIDLCRNVARVCRRWRSVIYDAAAIGKPLCTSAAAREAFLQGPLMAEQVGYLGRLLEESLRETRRRKPRAVLVRMLAANSGHVDCMARLTAHPWYDGACLVPAAARGHLDILVYAHENGCPWHYGVCTAAETYGRIDCLRYAHGAGCYWRGECDEAAENGHTDVLRYAKENGLGDDGELACRLAAAGGHVDTLRYACENGWPTCAITSWNAAEHGHLNVLKYVHESGGEWDTWTTWSALSGGYIDCLEYLLKNGCPGFDDACTWAAEKGQLRALQWLRAQGCPWSEETAAAAARGGHLDVLDWLCRHGCPWDRQTVKGAARYGRSDCLAYAIKGGCPFDDGDDLLNDATAGDGSSAG
ncbi:Ankyrin repeat domain containing protein [Pandoravirus dulcis]|uniref:Ankyrin repeat domain containing protein n=1 Tax=Pandoravirus dulcis TaxID=1349409 RepID=S4VT67_9VIRU|nr:Ankyrin repeat domain containing protein [Pandoravirus dulcis]AGO82605.1 Ankyrin repeat domain containing protein [Pandoravirus dulcis]